MNETPEPLAPDNHDPGLVLRDGVPVSTRFDDVYFSREDGLAETGHVFLQGCDLPDAWRGGTRFTIAETGFGTGLNFLAAWDLWRRRRPAGGVLHYLAVEGFPIPRSRLLDALAAFPGLADLAARLADRYPDPPVPGPHRIWFERDRVCLTLVIGEAEAALASIDARVDAWFLDGFAPARNPSMWRPEVLRQVARLSAPGARIASFTAAGQVRRDLAAVGFEIAKRPGFGRKRDCIAGRFSGAPTPTDPDAPPWFAPPPGLLPGRVAVIGGGIGGAALVRALRRRGVETAWVDRHGRRAAEASGNPGGLMMARATAGNDPQGAVSAACFRFGCAEARAAGLPVGGRGVLELATDAAAVERFSVLSEAGRLVPIGAELLGPEAASDIAGLPLDGPALWHRSGGWVDPRAWAAALAGDARPVGLDIRRIVQAGAGWLLTDEDGRVLLEADAVIVASAAGSAALLPDVRIPLEPVRGQLTRLAATTASRRLAAPLAFGGYLSPAISGLHVAGTTYSRDGIAPRGWPVPVRPQDHRRILSGLPPAVARLFADPPSILGGRAAIRAVTPDRQPIAGPVCEAATLAEAYGHLRTDARRRDGGTAPYLPGLHVLCGLGSRGLVTAPLMAELTVAQMLGDPLPVDRAVAEAVHPNRFTIRDLRRRRI
ncbi:MAG: bifunctional tRNA (5-methylaminomethyl-2-thiouridine)(34)-methyltransferase MnmD/FAD-dependent 5-carboxymethylaminomethyl-2-thiouridine(34) oxidoreductase MnmC [Thalassobaculaceae bacterium]